MGNNRVLTEFQMQMLSDIFRLVLKEIVTEEDKEKLAPGEMGISYQERTLYVRDPHSGELISPNSLEYLRPILNNYDQKTGLFNADTINYIKVYNSISLLQPLGIQLSPDSIIRQMVSPSILFSPVQYDNYDKLGFPTKKGIIIVYKMHEEYVHAEYYDLTIGQTYLGMYNSEKHLLEGWICTSFHDGIAELTSGGVNATATYGKSILDLGVIGLRLTAPITEHAELTIDNAGPYPILDELGNQLDHDLKQNTIIMLVYDELKHAWIYCKNNLSPQTVLNRVVSDRAITTASKIQIRAIESSYVRVAESDESTFSVPGYNKDSDILVVNYGQTILQAGLDYVFNSESNNVIELKTFTLAQGETLHFTITKFVTVL